MENKPDQAQESGCTSGGDSYPNGYVSCQSDTCVKCSSGSWIREKDPEFAGILSED